MKVVLHRARICGALLLLFSLRLALAQGTEPDAAAEALYSANGLFNRGLYELAADEYRAFLE